MGEAALGTSNVNQVGYLLGGPKRATISTTTREPASWQLVTDDDVVTLAGVAVPFGAPAGQTQIIDFSDFDVEGNYRLRVKTDHFADSAQFEIGSNLYDGLLFDVLDNFSQNRVEFVEDYALATAQLLGIVEREQRLGNDTGSGSVADLAIAEAKQLLSQMLAGQAGGVNASDLALAAVAAQMARLTVGAEPEYANQLVSAAEIGYAAAKAEVNSDDAELYWAAVELYLTTGDEAYLHDLRHSPFHHSAFHLIDTKDRNEIAEWARLQLALVTSDLPERQEIIAGLSLAADLLLEARSPYDLLVSPVDLLANAILIAGAEEATLEEKYLDAALAGIDYLAGRNPNGVNYLSENSLKHPAALALLLAYISNEG